MMLASAVEFLPRQQQQQQQWRMCFGGGVSQSRGCCCWSTGVGKAWRSKGRAGAFVYGRVTLAVARTLPLKEGAVWRKRLPERFL